MPPRFTEAERARITELLLETGQRLFTTQGLRKTSLDELATPAGIAKSSFYAFFESKEALYEELMLRQAPEIQRHLIEDVLTPAPDARAAISGFLRATLEVLDTNPLYRRLITHPDELQAVAARMDVERATAMKQRIALPLGEFLSRAGGELTESRTDVVLGLFRAVLLLPLHRTEFDQQTYAAVLDRLIDFVADGLAPGRPGE